MSKETRTGFTVTGEVRREETRVVISLRFEGMGLKKPQWGEYVFEGIDLCCLSAGHRLIDDAYQRWVKDALYNRQITSRKLLNVLRRCRKDVKKGVAFYEKAFRFLLHQESTSAILLFILTDDKSDVDVPEIKKREAERKLSQT
jgi:hypothetical protein